MSAGFRVVTYNVLAEAYLRREWYPRSPPTALEPRRRRERLLAHVAALDADVLCLQEVEAELFAALALRLEPLGCAGRWAQKGRGRPDGCATFLRRPLEERAHRAVAFADGRGGEPASGHLALLTLLEAGGRSVAVANTHLRWDPPGTPPEEQLGLAQARELVGEVWRFAPPPAGAIVCGDFNAAPGSEVLACLIGAGLRDVHGAAALSCNSNGVAKKIDFLLASRGLRAKPLPPPAIDDRTPLPSEEQPSDHLALGAVVAAAEG